MSEDLKWEVTQENDQWIAKVTLPEKQPITGIYHTRENALEYVCLILKMALQETRKHANMD